MDWFKGKFTGNHRFSHEIWGFPVNFPLIQSIDPFKLVISTMEMIYLLIASPRPANKVPFDRPTTPAHGGSTFLLENFA